MQPPFFGVQNTGSGLEGVSWVGIMRNLGKDCRHPIQYSPNTPNILRPVGALVAVSPAAASAQPETHPSTHRWADTGGDSADFCPI